MTITAHDKEKLAYEHVLGVLPQTQYQQLKTDDTFVKYVNHWTLQLRALQDNAPLTHKDQQQVWHNISHRLFAKTSAQDSMQSVFVGWLKYWRYQLGGMAILTTLMLLVVWQPLFNTQTNLPEWQISTNLDTQTLNVATTTHQHNDNSSACVLWVKHEDMFHFIDKLPETGIKNIPLDSKLLALIQQGSMVHSTEKISSFTNSETPNQPTKIDFVEPWPL